MGFELDTPLHGVSPPRWQAAVTVQTSAVRPAVSEGLQRDSQSYDRFWLCLVCWYANEAGREGNHHTC